MSVALVFMLVMGVTTFKFFLPTLLAKNVFYYIFMFIIEIEIQKFISSLWKRKALLKLWPCLVDSISLSSCLFTVVMKGVLWYTQTHTAKDFSCLLLWRDWPVSARKLYKVIEPIGQRWSYRCLLDVLCTVTLLNMASHPNLTAIFQPNSSHESIIEMFPS